MADIYVNSAWTDQAAFDADTTKAAELVWGSNAFNNLTDAVSAASVTEKTTITVAAGTYNDSIEFLPSVLGFQKSDIAFVAAEGAEVIFAGTMAIGYRLQNTGNEVWNAALSFDGITFDHAEAATHSLIVNDNKGISLTNCKIIGDGEYGIGSNGGNSSAPGIITNCTFENAGMQVLGNFGSGMEITDCVFNDSCVNIQGGNLVNFEGCTFNSTVTDANVGNSFYCIRSNNTAVVIDGCAFNIDSTVTGVAEDQAKWGVLWQRNVGSTKWIANDIEVNYTDAAMAQGELLLNKNGTTNAANATDRITINGITSTSNDTADLLAKSEGTLIVADGENTVYYDNGSQLTIDVIYVNSNGVNGNGKIFGYNAFTDFAAAMAAAKANSSITRIEIESDITSNSNVDTNNYYDIAQKLTIGVAEGAKYTVTASGMAFRVYGDGASLSIEDGVTIENLDVVADGFATTNEELVIDGKIKCLSLKVWTNNSGVTVNETGKVELGYGDGQFDMAYGNGSLTINGNLTDTSDASLTDGPQFKAGYSGTRGNGNTLTLNNAYFEGGAWFNVNGTNGVFALDNSVLKVSGGDVTGSLTFAANANNSVSVDNGSRVIVSKLTLNTGNSIEVSGSTLELVNFTNNGTLAIDAASKLTASTLTGEGTITLDAAAFAGGVQKVIDLSGTASLDGKITVSNLADGVNVYYGKDGDVALSDVALDVIYVDAAFTGGLGDDLGNGKYLGINAFAAVSDALSAANADTLEIRVSSNVTDAISGLDISGKIVKDGDTAVIITDSANDNYVNFRNASVGAGVTVEAQYMNLGSGVNTIAGSLKSGTTLYSLGSTVTTVTGSVEAYTTMSRKYTTADAGIYVVGTAEAGKGKDAAVQYKSTNYLGHYSGTFSLKDTAAEFGYINFGYAQEHTGSTEYSQGVIKLDNALMKTIGGPNTQPGQMLVVDGCALEAINGSVLDLRGPKDFGYLSMEAGTSFSFTDSTMYLGREGQGGNSLNGSVTLVNSTIDSLGKINNGGSITMDAGSMIIATSIAGAGTITIDASALNGVKKVIDLSGTASLEGKVTILGDGVTAIYGADGDVTVVNVATDTIYVNSAWAGKTAGDDLGDGKVFGVNAFDSLLTYVPAAGSTVLNIAGGTYETVYNTTSGVSVMQDGITSVIADGEVVVSVGCLVFETNAAGNVDISGSFTTTDRADWDAALNSNAYYTGHIRFVGADDTVFNLDGTFNAGENIQFLGGKAVVSADSILTLAANNSGQFAIYSDVTCYGAMTGMDTQQSQVVIINRGAELLLSGEKASLTTAIQKPASWKSDITVGTGTLTVEDGAQVNAAGIVAIQAAGTVNVDNASFSAGTVNNAGNIVLSGAASLSADKFANNNLVTLDNFAGTLSGMVKAGDEKAAGNIKVLGDTTVADTVDASTLSVGAWDEFAEGVAANDKLTIAEAGKVSVSNAYVQPGANMDVAGELNVIGGYNGVDGIFANYGKVNVTGTMNITNDASNGENLIGNVALDNSNISLNVAEGGTVNIGTTAGTEKTTLNVVNGAALDVAGAFNADAAAVINNSGKIEVSGEFNAAGKVGLSAYLTVTGLAKGKAREITVALLREGETDGGMTVTVKVDANSDTAYLNTDKIADGTYNLTIIDGTNVSSGVAAITNGTIAVEDGKLSIGELTLGNGAVNVTGESSVSVAKLTGTINVADAALTDSNINKGTVSFKGSNTYSGSMNANIVYAGDWVGEAYDASIDFGTDSNVNIGSQMIIGRDSMTAGANSVTFGDIDGAATDKVFKAADVSVRRDGVLTIANTTGENKINTMNVMGKVIIDNAKLSGEVQIGYSSADMGHTAEMIVQNGAEVSMGGSSNSVVVLGKSSGGKLTINNATFNAKRCGKGGGYNLAADTFMIGYNGATGVLTVENNGTFNATHNVLVSAESSITVTDSTLNVAGILTNNGSITISGNSLVKANVIGTITVTADTVFAADTALSVDGMITASGTVTAAWNTVSGNLTADTFVLTGVELPSDGIITVYSGKADVSQMVINGSYVAQNSIMVDGVTYNVQFTDTAVLLEKAADYEPIAITVDNVTQTEGTYSFVFGLTITGGNGEYTSAVTAKDAVTGVEISGTYDDASRTFTFDAAGTTTPVNFTIKVTDSYGMHTEIVTGDIVSVADYTAPEITDVTAVIDGTELALTWNAADNFGVIGYTVAINGAEYSIIGGANTSFNYTASASGIYSYTVTAFDAAGNKYTTSSAEAKLYADMVSSGVVISQVEGEYAFTADVAVTGGLGAYSYAYSVTDADGNAVAFTADGNKLVLADNTVKNVIVTVTVTDEAGNSIEASAASAVADFTAPELSVSGNVTGWTKESVTLTAAAADNFGDCTVQYQIGNGEWQTGTEAVLSANASVVFKAVDAAGNTVYSTVNVTGIDQVAPTVQFVSSTDAWTAGDVEYSVFASDTLSGVASVEYSTGNDVWNAVENGKVTVSENGTLYFKVTDNAGNITIDSVEVANIDKTAPALTVDVEQSSVTGLANVTINAVETGSGIASIKYSFNGSDWFDYTASIQVGANATVYVTAVDNLGNTSETSVVVDSITDIRNSILGNGYSQIVAWDEVRGAVGYVANAGTPGAEWQGVWEWNADEASMWKVVAVGNFGDVVNPKDGILLYNASNSTFAAWTDLGSGDYGYKSLAYVDGSFSVKCIANLDGDGIDDVLIFDGGNFGAVLNATEYKDIWHVEGAQTHELIGAGYFGAADGLDSLVVKNLLTNSYELWHNDGDIRTTWAWGVENIAAVDSDWTIAAIGDFQGDGIDDIVMWQKSTGYMFAWEDGNAENTRWVGSLDNSSWEVSAVGDYNGDGKEDLLLRELVTGWGGLGIWGGAYAGNWTDLNSRVESDNAGAKFGVIA